MLRNLPTNTIFSNRYMMFRSLRAIVAPVFAFYMKTKILSLKKFLSVRQFPLAPGSFHFGTSIVRFFYQRHSSGVQLILQVPVVLITRKNLAMLKNGDVCPTRSAIMVYNLN
jgi:hypothetical protein